jgi:hypothetical protein
MVALHGAASLLLNLTTSNTTPHHTMTKKHFAALAANLATTRPESPNVNWSDSAYLTGRAALDQWQLTRDGIAMFCSTQNPNFDRERFIAATEA